MKTIRIVASAALLLCSLVIVARATEITAGIARVEITPPIGFPMGGYTNRKGPSTGVHEPLYATALVLKTNGLTVAIVSCDLRSFPSERVVLLARERKLADHVLIAVTHTHSGPLTWEDKSWPSRERSWFAETEDKILRAIEDATKKMVSTRIAAGFGKIYLGHNRRKIESDGKVTMLWRNAEKVPTSPIDPAVGVIRVDDESGKARAIIVNFACHAVILGPDNRTISADYPGYLARRIEREFDGALSLFTQGGAGDINPLLDKTPLEENADAEMRRVGEQIGREVLRIGRAIRTEAPLNPEVAIIVEDLNFKNRWDLDKLKAQLTAAYGQRLTTRYRRYLVDPIIAPLTTLVINRQIALVGLPGEPFIGLQLSPPPATFLCGYTNGYIAYFPTIRDAVAGGYGADTITTRVEIGAGERLVDRGLIHIYRILGMLKDKPEQP